MRDAEDIAALRKQLAEGPHALTTLHQTHEQQLLRQQKAYDELVIANKALEEKLKANGAEKGIVERELSSSLATIVGLERAVEGYRVSSQELQQRLNQHDSTDTAAAALTKKQLDDLTASMAMKDRTIEQLQSTVKESSKTVNDLKTTVNDLHLQIKKDTEEAERLKKQVTGLADTKKTLVG